MPAVLLKKHLYCQKNLINKSENLGPIDFKSRGIAANASLLKADLKSQQLSPKGISNYRFHTCLKFLCWVKSFIS